MRSLEIVNEDRIIFKRIPSSNVKGYKIYVEETLGSGKVVTRVLEENYENPATPRPVKYIARLPYSKSGEWEIDEDIYEDDEYPVEVFLNGVRILASHRTYSHKLKKLMVRFDDEEITEEDVLEIEYYKDEIEYINKTSEKCKYYVEPIIKYAHNVGTHNIIR